MENLKRKLSDENDKSVESDGEVNEEEIRKKLRDGKAESLSSKEIVAIRKKVKRSMTSQFRNARLEDEMVFVICVDGSEHSEYGFDIVEDLYRNNSKIKMIVTHIYNSKQDHLYNYYNKKDTVLEKYNLKIQKYAEDVRALLVAEDRSSETHALEQVLQVGQKYAANFLVCGYYGIKGAKQDNKELSKGIDYLLSFSRLPFILMKENPLDTTLNSRKKFSWLFIFDRQFSNCTKILDPFIKLIDSGKDYVYGIGLKSAYGNADEELEKEFKLKMQQSMILNCEFEHLNSSKDLAKQVSDRVNFGQEKFDFLVFYNNPDYYKKNKVEAISANIIIHSKCNICVLNG